MRFEMATKLGMKPVRTIATRKRLWNEAKNPSALVKQVLVENTAEFCKNSTIQGLHYVADRKLHFFERFYFFIAFVIVVAFAFFFAGQVIAKWDRTPMIFGFNPDPNYIGDEPFPAVSICNLNAAYKSQTQNISKFSTKYAMLQMLCKHNVNTTRFDNSKDAWSGINDFISQISQPCERMLLQCIYGAVKYNCSDLFMPIMTEEGMCCSFNLLHPKYVFRQSRIKAPKPWNTTTEYVFWSPEIGYADNLPENISPRRIVGTGEKLGLRLVLDVESHEYYCSSSNSVGFKFLLHSPGEVPNLHEIGLLLAAGRETKIRIRSEKLDSEETLRTLCPSRRRCYFENEFNLMLYQRYNSRNCEIECIANMTLKNCGCMPHHSVDSFANVSFCSLSDLKCVEQVNIKSSECTRNCLPNCYDMAYYPDFFSTPLRASHFKVGNKLVNSFNRSYVKDNIAIVHIYYSEHCFRGFKQTEFISGTDVLSSIGGLIGLFFGFSFISVAEFIFFALIRPWRVTRKDRSNEVQNGVITVRPTANQEKLPFKENSMAQLYNLDFNRSKDRALASQGDFPKPNFQSGFMRRQLIFGKIIND